MTEYLKNNPIALRHFILFEVLQGTPINEAYSKFCRTIGNDFMEYREFDFWYYRFVNGEYDPNFERDKNKKIYELSDMPILVMKKIVGDLNIFDRISLSKTSRSFRTFVDNQKLFHRTLTLEVYSRIAEILLGGWVNIEYTGNQIGCMKTFKNRKTWVNGVSFWEQVLRDFKNILKNPKLHLDTLNIELNVPVSRIEPFESVADAVNILEDALKFTHYLNVEELVLREYASDQFSKILPKLKPGYLTTINIFSSNENLYSMNTVFEMEQWKQAKWFGMAGASFIWPLHHLYHFEEFTVILKKLSVEDVRQMKEVLFASPNFKQCLVAVCDDTGANAIKEEFGDYVLQEKDTSELKNTYHYPITNSREYFQIEIFRNNFEITRKKR